MIVWLLALATYYSLHCLFTCGFNTCSLCVSELMPMSSLAIVTA
jgi:hypothetical protein